MNAAEKSQYEMLVRVRNFGAARSSTFSRASLGGDAFAAVDAAVSALNRYAAAHYSDRSEKRGSGASLKTPQGLELVEALELIGLTARAVALDTPGVEKQFRLPRERGRRALLNAARAFARNVEPLATSFVAHGMPADFVAQLTAKIDGFESLLKERETNRELSASSRAAMEEALASGTAAVLRLDAIVTNVLLDDEVAMAAWTVARRAERKRSAKRPSTSSSPPLAATMAAPEATAVTPAVSSLTLVESAPDTGQAGDADSPAVTPPAAALQKISA